MRQKLYCPYCNHEYDEDYFSGFREDANLKEMCLNCGKYFILNVSVMIDYDLRKQCEWNGEKHSWRDIGNDCVICDECNYIELKKNAEGWEE
jgi:NAD-dependent SIR2 family protein deacetylase